MSRRKGNEKQNRRERLIPVRSTDWLHSIMETQPIDISKLDKAEVLAALYNNSRRQGMGFLNARGREPLTKEQAAELLKETTYFDYLAGRVMKVELKGDTLDPWLYDRDNGAGAAARALEPLMESNAV